MKGISVGSKEFKILQYADDTILFLDGTAASFCNALHILDSFGNCSGLKMNIQKTDVIWIGASKCNENIEGRHVNFVHNYLFRYLRADFHVFIDKIPDYTNDR